MELELRRDNNTLHNWGKLFVDGKYLGETLEDVDRFLEDGGKKVQDDTATVSYTHLTLPTKA